MTSNAPVNATATHFDIEPFATVAFAELAASPLVPVGQCLNPACSRQFAPARAWQTYCCAACRVADAAEFRLIGHRIAPAILAHRLGKYTRASTASHDPEAAARRALCAAARRFLGEAQTEWKRSREARIRAAKGGQS